MGHPPAAGEESRELYSPCCPAADSRHTWEGRPRYKGTKEAEDSSGAAGGSMAKWVELISLPKALGLFCSKTEDQAQKSRSRDLAISCHFESWECRGR